ncbi:SagB/ThcOx family dehydrogenase [Halovivax limisalsi]|uniref:SagB/ThcOx family dehydrogenase n=1 Tax=Halovivax limisalsi TaxID=1453760 RepID=UPI001FFD92E1|nr:SagB/ThcOx family dehydrogenase [Halovivax limisalsi]
MTDARSFHEATNHHPEDIHAAPDRDSTTRPPPEKRYADRPVVELDGIAPPWSSTLSLLTETRTDPRPDAAGPASDRVDAETVATLCYEASGITSVVERDGAPYAFRAASCTGKLYHVECYVVCGDLDGIDAGVYHFDPTRFGLDAIRTGDVRNALATAVGDPSTGSRPAERVSNAPVTVVTTSHWWRNAWKYADRTYRHAFWDSGTVLANLLAAAHGCSLPADVVAGFADDQVARLLGVDPTEEGPTAVVPIGDGRSAPASTTLEAIDPSIESPTNEAVSVSAIRDAWTASSLTDGSDADEWRDRVRAFRSDPSRGRNGTGSEPVGSRDGHGPPAGDSPAQTASGATDELATGGTTERIDFAPADPATAGAHPFHSVVLRRGSCRDYANDGPTKRQVATVLDRATRGVPGDWNGGNADHLSFLDAYVLATGVEGLPDGSYRYRPATDRLGRLGDVDRETKAHLALDQPWAGDAHVTVYLLADLDAIVDSLGNRGYRLAHLEAGLTLGRLYLATYAHRDLGGLGLTFFDDLVTEHFEPAASGRAPMTSFAFGRRSD